MTCAGTLPRFPAGAKLVIVAAGHPTSYNQSHAMAYIAPVSLRTIVGM